MVTKMLTEVRRTVHEQSEKFNKDLENIRKQQAEHSWRIQTELKNSTEGFNIKLDQVEEKTSALEDWAMEFIQSEQKKKRMKKSKNSLRHLWHTIKCTIFA